VLKDETRTDAVLLRLAIAGSRASAPTAARDVAEMRDRIALDNQRARQWFRLRQCAVRTEPCDCRLRLGHCCGSTSRADSDISLMLV